MQLLINQKHINITEGKTILEAIYDSQTSLLDPLLGSMKDYIPIPSCPLLGLAEINGELCSLALLAVRPIRENMEIVTKSNKIKKQLELQAKLLKEQHECYFIKEWQHILVAEAESDGYITVDEWEHFTLPERGVSPSIFHNPNQCVRCQACVDTCQNIQGVGALSFDENIGIVFDESRCVRCGQCIHRCPMGIYEKFQTVIEMFGCQDCAFARPLGAMREVDDTFRALELLENKDNYCVVQFAPAVRASIGEEFGLPDGELVTKKLYASLHRLGFKKVWDTNFAADLTIMEEGTELIERIQNNGRLPQFTSCSPGWIRFVETFFPDLLPNISTAKSPQQMFGAVAKTYGAKTIGIDPSKIKVISIMPCTAKKSEAVRPEMNSALAYWNITKQSSSNINYQDVDLVLTTRELGRLLKIKKIDLSQMPEENPDSLLSAYSGAAPIFGRTGGVMEAALRTAITILTNKTPESLEFDILGSTDGIKRASLVVNNLTIKVAVAHGLTNARKVCESIISGGEFAQYHFIEVMTCPGGCVSGGGQPIPTNAAVKRARTLSLNRDDREICTLRMSHENPEVKSLYNEFLDKPLSHLSHKLLHTQYTPRNIIN